jgi:hypothetical protein
MEILFLITFLVCVAVINADPICAAVLESIIDRTAAPELLILIVFLVCATIINFVGMWWREGGSHGGTRGSDVAGIVGPAPPSSTPRRGGYACGDADPHHVATQQ